MKLLIKILSIIIIIILFSCAKQSTPMGGEKDTIPPKLIANKPINESTNIKPQNIELEFDEYVKIENPSKLIIITPKINKEEMVVSALKNKVILKLNQELEDNTTYVFNFQKSIQDITESNSAENLKLVFSTGDYIDSLKLNGQVSYIFPPKEKFLKDVLVGLYQKNDTTNVLTATPYYISTTDSTGNFEITNIKAGEYRSYAWFDSNNNLKAEEKSEPYAFLGDTLTIDKNILGIEFSLSKADISAFKINRSAPNGENFDIVLSKFPTDIMVKDENINKKLFYRLKEKNLRFYHTELKNDSIQTRLILKDSVGFTLDTLVYLKFEDSDRTKEKLTLSINSGQAFLNEINAEITLNKPIKNINLDSLFVKYDTASIIRIQKDWIYLKDSTNFTKININIPITDSLRNSTYTLFAADSSFQDVEGLYNEDKIEAIYKKLDRNTLVTSLDVTIDTDFQPLIVQLLDRSGEKIIKEAFLENTNKHSFVDFEAGIYNLRVIFDQNRNKRWDPSNMIHNKQAEKVYYYRNPKDPESLDIIVKSGWTNSITVITKTNKNTKAVELNNNIEKVINKVDNN